MNEFIIDLSPGDIIQFTYKNWKGEIAQRRAKIIRFGFGSTPWHETPQFLMLAMDLDKNEPRKYATCDMSEVKKEESEC